MAVLLAEKGISTTLITDSAVGVIMPRVNKVIIGTHAVMANGGVIGFSGLYSIALCAQSYGVQVVVCTGLYKLSPLYPNDTDAFAAPQGPQLLDYNQGLLFIRF